MGRPGKDVGHGWIPPQLHTINITKEEYDYLTGSKLNKTEPLYEVLERVITKTHFHQEELQDTKEFLEARIEDKKQLREENSMLKEELTATKQILAVAMEEKQQIEKGIEVKVKNIHTMN
jgi:chromosome segregation ATPase